MMPITFGKPGEKYLIRKISGVEKVRQHLAELGFVVDAEVTVVNGVAGNLIVKVKGARIAIGKEIANHVMV